MALGLAGFRNFPVQHPHYLGAFDLQSDYVKRGVDLPIVVGARDFGGRAMATSPIKSIEPPGSRVVRIGIDTAAMGRTSPPISPWWATSRKRWPICAPPSNRCSPRTGSVSSEPLGQKKCGRLTSAARAKAEAEAEQNFGQNPIHPDELGATLARAIDPNAIVVSENLTGKYDAFPFGFRENEPMWLGNTGAGLGWGVGAATGAKLAAPDRQVICSIGDGSVMYSASGFWTQARYGIPVSHGGLEQPQLPDRAPRL